MNKAPPIPPLLKQYITTQNYNKYSPEDQCVWRYILRQLKDFLAVHAHKAYVKGLKQTGITINTIPRISDIDRTLQKLGWRAVPVSSFIPPAVFMEFQAHNILPIASSIRTMQHISYTPAPDIVHEAAGHAPFLIHPVFNSFLKKYAQVIKFAIPHKEDFEQYTAIRTLSDLKENPHTTARQIKTAENKLKTVSRQAKTVSEAAALSRFIWWTSEYGLAGRIHAPKIYGAGLLSSIGEARRSLSRKVKKLPLDVSCIEYGYDITDYQPQLFVTPHFEHLHTVLNDLKKQCAFYRGGAYGLNKAQKSKVVCTVELNTGLQISGAVDEYSAEQQKIHFIKLTGPCQLSFKHKELKGHSKAMHSQGFSSPLGALKNQTAPLSCMSVSDIKKHFVKNHKLCLEFASGYTVKGEWQKTLIRSNKILLLSLKNARVQKGRAVCFRPEWGAFDLAVGEQAVSVFGGPADRTAFGGESLFLTPPARKQKISQSQKKYFAFYKKIRHIRQRGYKEPAVFKKLLAQYNKQPLKLWLAGVELLELAYLFNHPPAVRTRLKQSLTKGVDLSDNKRPFIKHAIQLIEREYKP